MLVPNHVTDLFSFRFKKTCDRNNVSVAKVLTQWLQEVAAVWALGISRGRSWKLKPLEGASPNKLLVCRDLWVPSVSRLSWQFLPLLRTLAFSLGNCATYCRLSILLSPQDLFGAQTPWSCRQGFPCLQLQLWISRCDLWMRLKLHSLKCRILHLCMPRWFCQSNCCVQILWPRNWLGQDLSKLVGSVEKKLPHWLAPIFENCGCLHAPWDLAQLFVCLPGHADLGWQSSNQEAKRRFPGLGMCGFECFPPCFFCACFCAYCYRQ